LEYVLIVLAGIAAGFVNTLAGGGSTLTLAALTFAGLPSPVANATNRVAIFFQTGVATLKFKKHDKLRIKPILHITAAAIVGAIVGSLFAVNISSEAFDIVLGIVFIFILIMMLRPKNNSENSRTSLPKWAELLIFSGVGLYGGFVQAGVGFIFLATLNLVESFNLVKANAAKVFIVLCYTVFSLIVFASSGKIMWGYGLLLAAGNVIGAYIGAASAIKKGEKIVKIVLAIAIAFACLKLFGVIQI
jgi:uncharacterized membrane protein YfcA